MPLGLLLCIIAMILTQCGVLDGVLKACAVRRAQACTMFFLLFLSALMPDMTVGRAVINPLNLLIMTSFFVFSYMQIRDTVHRLRSALGCVVSTLLMSLSALLLPYTSEMVGFSHTGIYTLCCIVASLCFARTPLSEVCACAGGTLIGSIGASCVSLLKGDTNITFGGIELLTVFMSSLTACICVYILYSFTQTMLRRHGRRLVKEAA